MMLQDTRLYAALAIAGTIPFIAGALLPLLGYPSLPVVGSTDQLVASYGLAIVCFLTGAHWGTYLGGRSVDSLNLFITSNVILLAAWFAYIATAIKVAISIQVIALLILLYIDRRLAAGGVISAHYFRIRTVATTIATLSLLVVVAA
jgi:hypothetical protein